MSQPLNDNELTLPEIAATLDPPDPALLKALLAGTTEVQLVDKGRLIASSRIVTDTRRLYATAYAYYAKATPAQRKKLRGFSLKLLALAVAQAITLDEMRRDHEGRSLDKDAIRTTRDADLRDAFTRALGLRDQLHDVLLDVAGHAPAAREEIDQAVGTAEKPELLVRGLEQLSLIGSRFLDEATGPIHDRAALFEFDQNYLAEVNAAAKTLENAIAAATVRPAGTNVSQGDLDKADGLNLMLLGHVIRAFDNAHDQDPTIPTLVPIATRRMFNRRAATKKKSDSDEGKERLTPNPG